MQKVYVLTIEHTESDNYFVEGVYSSRELAEQKATAMIKRQSDVAISIEDFTIDGGII